ncbi:MAG: amidohydrolase [Fimbriimonas sp.]
MRTPGVVANFNHRMTLYTNFRWGYTGEPQEMLVENGRVVSRGPESPSGSFPKVDLGGRYLLPSFVDAHCHILPTGLDLLKLHLGAATSKTDVQDLVRQRHEDQPEGWLHAVHYDQNRYGGHLTRDDLDAISSERPILLRHVNGHASVANSAALRAAGVTEETPDPTGGEYARDASGRLTGVLLELAHEHVSAASPLPTLEEMVAAILRAGESMRALGIACASDMMTGFMDLDREMEAYRLAISRGCPIAMRLYVQWKPVFGPKGVGAAYLRTAVPEGDERLQIAGIKLFSDGAISSATAAIYGQFSGAKADGPRISRHGHTPVAEDGREVSGQLIYRPARLNEMVQTAHDAGFPVSIHAIGDYAVDLTMDAFEATGEPSRHRVEHATMLVPSQIERLAALGCETTFQPEFLMRLGHAYLRQLGPERAARMKPARSALDAGVRLSFSSDRPIVAGDPWDGILTASDRPEGYDASENVTREEAVRLYSEAGSRANGDGNLFGSLAVGTRADFQVYEMDPMTHSRPRPEVQV